MGGSGGVGVWDAQAGRQLFRERVGQGALNRVAFGAQGSLLAAGAADGGVHVVDLRARQVTEAARHRKPVTGVALSADGAVGASGDAEGRVLLWDPARGGVTGELREQGHKKEVLYLAFTGADQLVSLSCDLQVITWDVRGKRALRRGTLQSEGMGVAGVPEAASLDPDRALLAISTQVRTLPRGALTARRGMARPSDMQRENVIVPYAVETGISRDPVPSGEFLAERLALGPGGCLAVFSSFQASAPRLHVWDLVQRGEDLLRLDLDGRASALALDPGGRRLAVGFEMGWLRLYAVSGAGAEDCQARRAGAAARPAGEPRIALGAEGDPLIPAGAGYRVAVLRFEAGGLEAYLADAVAEMLAGELSNSRHVQVVERREIEAIVREMEIQKSGLTTADAVRIGRGLNARKVVFGSVRRFGETTFVVLARLVDVETQRVEGTRQVTCEGCGEKDLPRAAATLARALVR